MTDPRFLDATEADMIEDLLGRAYSEIARRAARGDRDAILRQDPRRAEREDEAWDEVEAWFAPDGRHAAAVEALLAPKKKAPRAAAGATVQIVKASRPERIP